MFLNVLKRRLFLSAGSNYCVGTAVLYSYTQRCNSLRRTLVRFKISIQIYALLEEEVLDYMLKGWWAGVVPFLFHTCPMSYTAAVGLFAPAVSFFAHFSSCYGSPASILTARKF